MLMRALSVHIAHETAGAARIRHSLRPLTTEGEEFPANLGRNASREREAISAVIPGRAKHEPGIHNHDQEYGFRALATRAPERRKLLKTPSRSRGALRPRFAVLFAPFKTEGAGNAGCALHPRSHVQWVERVRT